MPLAALGQTGWVEVCGVTRLALEQPVSKVLAVGVSPEALETRESLVAGATEKPPEKMLLNFMLDHLWPCGIERASTDFAGCVAGC